MSAGQMWPFLRRYASRHTEALRFRGNTAISRWITGCVYTHLTGCFLLRIAFEQDTMTDFGEIAA